MLCGRCKQDKPETEEYFRKYKPYGKGLRTKAHKQFVGTCRTCQAGYCSRWYKKNKQKVADASRQDYQANPVLKKASSASYKKRHPKKVAQQAWATGLKKKYGITVEQYAALYDEQDGRCAICRGLPLKKLFDVDHDHVTGKIRQLLCRTCNLGLGHFADDPMLLQRAAAYLERHTTPLRVVSEG